MIGKFVKGSTAALNLLNQRAFTIMLFLVGIAGGVVLYPSLIEEGVTKREAVGLILMVFLPYLIFKGVILLLILALDVSTNFSAKKADTYKMNYEKAKARVAKIFIDKNVAFTKVDNFEFGIERYLVIVLQKYLTGTKFNYPANFISVNPFIVARLYDLKDGRTQVKVLYEEEREAETLGRLIVASMQALESEEAQRVSAPQFNVVAGAIRPNSTSAPSTMELVIPEKGEEKKPTSLIDRFKQRKRKK